MMYASHLLGTLKAILSITNVTERSIFNIMTYICRWFHASFAIAKYTFKETSFNILIISLKVCLAIAKHALNNLKINVIPTAASVKLSLQFICAILLL